MSAKKRVSVIGAGLGGLSAAASLAAKGFEVALYEKNDKLGGKLNHLEQQGFSFDLGPSIIILPHLFKRVFEQAGRRFEDYVQFDRLEPQWRSFFEDRTVIDLHGDLAEMERELNRLGEDAAGYFDYVEYSRKLYRFAEEAYLENGADSLSDILRGHSLREVMDKTDLFSTMYQGVARYIREPHLREVLAFFIKYVGSSSHDAPGLMNLLPYSQLGYGLWYVRGGMYNLARGFERLLNDLGVEIHLNAEVTRILKDGKRVKGITVNGQEILSDYVVSNMEVIPALKRLLGEGPSLRMKAYEYIYEPAASGLVIHVGTDKKYPQLAHHNFFFAQDPKLHLDTIHRKKQLPEDPTLYVVSPTQTDPGLAPDGHEIIKILPHIPCVQDPPFTPEAYEALEQRVFDKLERMGLTDLRAHIVTKHVLVPEDLERMYYSNKGAIYGVVTDRKRNFSFKAPKQSGQYQNLYFTGGSVNPGGGTPMVVLCGQKVAELIERDSQGDQR